MASSKDRDQIDRLIREHYVPIYRFLSHMSRRAEDAEDLAQQTFLRAITAWERYDGRVPLRAWLYAIAYNEFFKLRRRRLWIPLRADRPSEGDPYGRVLDADLLLRSLASLTPATKAVFLLHYVEELSILEIADVLKLPEGTVKSRLYAARQSLQTLLKEDYEYAPDLV